jgi:hypothetical protein
MTGSAVQIQRTHYWHDAIIDEIIRDPAISQNELAKLFGFSATWMSICVNSDAFQNSLKQRKAELTDPKLVASINERLDGIAKRALDRIIDKLDGPAAIKDSDLIQMAKLGVGDKNTRAPGPVVQNNLYVVHSPPPAKNSQEWIENVSVSSRVSLPLVEQN